MVSSLGSLHHDAFPIAENFLCIKSEIPGNSRS
jgi:hypothetical protein